MRTCWNYLPYRLIFSNSGKKNQLFSNDSEYRLQTEVQEQDFQKNTNYTPYDHSEYQELSPVGRSNWLMHGLLNDSMVLTL